MSEDELIDMEIARMLEDGSLVISGMVNGEPYYNMVPEIMKQTNPAFYEIMVSEIDESLIVLYEQGLLKVDYDENLNAMFSLTDEGIALAEEIVRNGDGLS